MALTPEDPDKSLKKLLLQDPDKATFLSFFKTTLKVIFYFIIGSAALIVVLFVGLYIICLVAG